MGCEIIWMREARAFKYKVPCPIQGYLANVSLSKCRLEKVGIWGAKYSGTCHRQQAPTLKRLKKWGRVDSAAVGEIRLTNKRGQQGHQHVPVTFVSMAHTESDAKWML